MNVTCPACGGSGDRNGNLRASDPFGTCPGCDGRGIREAVYPSPPEPAPHPPGHPAYFNYTPDNGDESRSISPEIPSTADLSGVGYD